MAKSVLITTAIVVHVSDDGDDGFTPAEPFADRLSRAIKDAFRDSPAVEYPATMSFDWLDESAVNVGKCAACGIWVSDYTQAEVLKGIPGGRRIDGSLLCDECECFGNPPHAAEGRADT